MNLPACESTVCARQVNVVNNDKLVRVTWASHCHQVTSWTHKQDIIRPEIEIVVIKYSNLNIDIIFNILPALGGQHSIIHRSAGFPEAH